MMFPMRPNNRDGGNERGNYYKKISFIGKNNAGKNDNRDTTQKIKSLDFPQLIIIKRAVENEIGNNSHSNRNEQ